MLVIYPELYQYARRATHKFIPAVTVGVSGVGINVDAQSDATACN